MYSQVLRRSCSHLTSPSVISYLLDSEVEQQVASFTLKSFTHQRLIRQFWQKIIAKFIVLRCAFANFEWVFLFRQSFDLMSGGIVNASHNATHSLSLAGKNNTENDSRQLKNRKSWWWVDFLSRAGGRHCFILARDKNKKDQKNLRRKLVDCCPKQGDHKERTLKHRHKQSGEMHRWQVNRCFLRGPRRWLTVQKKRQFLWSLENAQRDTTNLAISPLECFITLLHFSITHEFWTVKASL